jgi:hypothetical protein
MTYPCDHLGDAAGRARHVTPSSDGCEDCLRIGGQWVHLRLCLTCGHVGCCDDSPNRHATHHFNATDHPVIRSYEPGEDWAYCYPDDAFAPRLPGFPEERARAHHSAP